MEHNNSRAEIGFLNAAFCLMVILIHILAVPVGALERSSGAYFFCYAPWRLSALVVQGFLFLSAMKMAMKYKNAPFSYGAFLKRRALSVALPYVAWVLVYDCYFVFCRRYFDFNMFALVKYIFNGQLVGHFYFIIALAQFYLLMPLWLFLARKKAPWVIGVSFVITLLSILAGAMAPYWAGPYPRLAPVLAWQDRWLFTYLLFWVLGLYAGTYYEKWKEFLKKHGKKIVFIFAAFAVLDLGLGYFASSRALMLPALDVTNNIIHYLYAIFGIFAFYLAASRLAEKGVKSRLVALIGASSYNIYLCHCLVLFVMEEFYLRFGISSQKTIFFINFVVVYLVSVGGCALYTALKGKLIKRIKSKKQGMIAS